MLKHFNYWLTGYGWAEVTFASDSQSIQFEFSYVSDPLADLIDSLLELLRLSKNETCVHFFDEPGCYRLTLTMVEGANLSTQVRTFAEVDGSPDIPKDWNSSKLIFETWDTLDNICSVIVAGIVDLRHRQSESEYLENWINYPFPSNQLKLLEELVTKTKD